jgi:hypothetical protein
MRWAIATAVVMAALAATPAAAATRTAGVRVAECVPADHAATFYAHMLRVPHTGAMSIRLTLLQRTGRTGFAPLKLPSLSHWHISEPGRRGFAVRQQVRNLIDGAAYRARVEFRWRDRRGTLLSSARRTSSSCRIVGRPLPNLRARPVWARPTNVKGVLRYGVRVVNVGHAGADNVPVRLSVDGSEVNTKTVPSLAPGQSQLLIFQGPACEHTVSAMADPAGLIPEGSESDNGRQLTCAELGH